MKILHQDKSALFKKYDLIGENRRVLEKDNRVDSLLRLLSQKLEENLSQYIQRVIEISPDQITFEEIRSIGNERGQGRIDVLGKIGDDKNHLLGLKISRQFTYRVVDMIFGGIGEVPEKYENEVEAESEKYVKDRIVDIVVTSIVQLLNRRDDSEEQWATFDDLEEATQQLNANMIKVPLQISVGDFTDEVEIWLAVDILERLAGVKLEESSVEETQHIAPDEILHMHLLPCEVELRCSLPSREIDFRDALSLKEGDLIPVGCLDKATVAVENTDLLSVQIGIKDGNVSAKVLGWI